MECKHVADQMIHFAMTQRRGEDRPVSVLREVFELEGEVSLQYFLSGIPKTG